MLIVERCASSITFACVRYLDDPQFRNTFESAHSVVLSIFANHKRCVTELAPYYTELLLKVSGRPP